KARIERAFSLIEESVDLRIQLAAGVALEHAFQGDGLDLAGIAGGAEGFVTGDADVAHGGDGLGEVFARIELAGVLRQELANRARGGQTQVGVDVDLAHAVLDALDDFLDRHAVGFADLAAVFVDDLQPLLRHRGRAVHYQMRVGDARMDFLDALDRQGVAGRRLGELVGAVAGADGDGQGIDLGLGDEVGGFFRIGQQLAVVEHALGTDAVLFTGHAGFQAAQAAQFALHGDAAGMGEGHSLLGHAHVVVVVGRGLAVFTQRAVHHRRGEAQLDRALADAGAGAVVLVPAHRDMPELYERRPDPVAEG